ncbi:MAG: protoporphyrinogen oxidase [Balneolia bacterium]|nr:protoporphyrinogen oxidase [Balneolia bacterium]
MVSKSEFIVAGGGISGLTVAHKLSKRGRSVTLVHSGKEAGGALRTVEKNGWILETGPNTIVESNTYLRELIDELGMRKRVVTAQPVAKNRYIVKNKKLVPLPGGAMEFIRTPLFSGRAKLRLFKEPFIRKGTDPDESLANFVRRRLGGEFLDYAINPFVAGVYAGDPENLSMRMAFPMLGVLEDKYGSLIKGQFKIKPEDRKKGDLPRASAPMISFKSGNREFVKALTDSLGERIRADFNITKIKKNTDGYVLESADGIKAEGKNLILTLPLFALQNIEWSGFDEDLKELPETEYPPLTVVHLGYKKEQVAHLLDGFGMLVPAAEKMNILGCLFNSSLFQGRTPEDDHHLLTCFIGGSRSPDYARETDEMILKRVKEDINLLLGAKSEPVMYHITRWDKAIPQYTTAYKAVYNYLGRMEEKHTGLHYLGNFRNGISVPDCIRNAVTLAEKLNS